MLAITHPARGVYLEPMAENKYTLSHIMIAHFILGMTIFTLFYRYGGSGRDWNEAIRLAVVFTTLTGIIHLAYWTWTLKRRGRNKK